MKKKLILKIFFNLILILSTICFIIQFISQITSAKTYFQMFNSSKNPLYKEFFTHAVFYSILSISCALFSVMFFIFYNFKDIQWLCGSLAKEIKEHKEATAEERKQKKIDDLQKQLDELKKE